MSTISRIRARVEARVARRLIPRLINDGVAYHCRKRLRYWCDCNYCRAKKKGSWEIGIVGQGFQRSYPYDEWEIYSRIKAIRQRKIQALHQKLKEIREEPYVIRR